VRLIVALSVAAALAVFLFYTVFASGATQSLRPSQMLAGNYAGKEIQLAGVVVPGSIVGDPYGGGMHFMLRDFDSKRIDGGHAVEVLYSGAVPDLFQGGRHIYLQGTLEGGVFRGVKDSLVTKCPSKYAPKKSPSSV
jgi:cytochrome c-type biogenesis protein CcmE